MKLLSIGAISPYGSTLKEHCENKGKQFPPRITEISFLLEGKSRGIKIEECYPLTLELPVPDSVLRRSSRSAQMTLSSIEEARKTFAALKGENLESKKIGVLVGSPYGATGVGLEYIKKLVRSNFKMASPNLFAQSVHNNLASTVAITYALKGPTLTLVQKENLWTSLLQIADLWIEEKTVDYVWLVIGNETCHHFPYREAYRGHHSHEFQEGCALHPNEKEITSEAFASFLLASDEKFPHALCFSLEESSDVLRRLALEKDTPLVSAERIGISLAEHYFPLLKEFQT